MTEHSPAKNAKRANRCRVCGKYFRYRGAVVQHVASGLFYKIENGNFVLAYKAV